MFKAVINAETLRDAIESVSSLVDEVKFSISEKGLELKAVDPANVAMVSLKIGAEAFEYFNAVPGEIGVDLVRLSDVLSMAEKGETVQLELDEESHKLKIGVGSLSYTLSLIDPTAIRKEPRIPELDLPAHVTLPGGELRRAVPDASLKMLTKHLKELEADGIFSRTIYPEIPPRVEYRLSALGHSFIPVLESMLQWGDVHCPVECRQGACGPPKKKSRGRWR
jgi:proliferating cell nuclear antigen